MPDQIKQYEKNVFTNVGQSDVAGFAVKLAKVATQINAAGAITVYYGFHGDTSGNFDRNFDEEELAQSLKIAQAFKDAKMVQVSGPDDPNIKYTDHNTSGQVLFTWCDSETYIRKNLKLPSIVA